MNMETEQDEIEVSELGDAIETKMAVRDFELKLMKMTTKKNKPLRSEEREVQRPIRNTATHRSQTQTHPQQLNSDARYCAVNH